MKRFLSIGLFIFFSLLLFQSSYAAGSPSIAKVFATSGNEPTLTIVVTDANGLGCLGVPVTIAVTSGSGSAVFSSATTEADGTTTVAITGSTVGDTINVFCSTVTTGQSNTVTAAAARAVATTDAVTAWFDEPRHTFYGAVIDPSTNVMVTTVSGSVDNDDIDNNGDVDTNRMTYGQIIMQDPAANPYEREVYQGTYNSANIIRMNVDEITGDPDVSVNLASLSNTLDPVLGTTSELLNAYAIDGANPQVVAVVIDREGRGIKGVTITAQASAGSMAPGSIMTNDNGVAIFQQSGGSLGDTITVRSNLPETMPIVITTENSVAISLTSKVFSWFERKTRTIHTAIVNRDTHVLVQNSTDIRRDVDEILSDNIYPYPGNFIEQTSVRPGSSYVVHGGSEAGDLIRIFHYGTIHRYPGGATYNSGLHSSSVITMPANESQYLMAGASGGTDPNVWAIVADSNGNAVKNVPINYTLTGSGALAESNTVTVWSGIASNKITGAAIGDTLTVWSDGLGAITIYLSNTVTATSEDRTYGVYDSETHNVFGLVVQSENNVMTDTFSQTQFIGYDELDQTPTNGIDASISYYFHPQTDYKLCQGYTGFGTIGAGDILRLRSTYTNPTYDVYIRAAADPDEFLMAFAMAGDQVGTEVWAVVMDKYGNAVQGKNIAFSTTGGALTTGSGTTNYGGYAVDTYAALMPYGNTITVSSPGLPPVNIWPSSGSNYTTSDQAYMWFDPTTLLLRNVTVEIDKKLLSQNDGLSSTNVQVFDNSSNNRTIAKGSAYDQYGTVNATVPQRIGYGNLIFGTAGVGDVIRANFGTGNDFESFITIQSLNTQYLHAYAYGSTFDQTVVAVVTDADGNAVPGIIVTFSSPDGSVGATPPGGFVTDINGMVSNTYSAAVSYYEKIVVSTGAFSSSPVNIITLNHDNVDANYKAIPSYNKFERKVNVVYAHSYYNCVADNGFSIETITAIDNTSNQKTISVGPLSTHPSNAPAVAYVSHGTHAQGDQISINDTTAEGSPDALITLAPSAIKNLYSFGTGGVLPVTITAIVVDENGNGLSGETVSFTPSGGGAMSITNTVTDATGKATSLFYGPATLGSSVTIDAPFSVTFTATVTTANSVGVANDSRVYPWYSILDREAHAAIVTLNNNILTSSGTINFTAVDATPNGRTFAIGTAIQQSSDTPASVVVTNGTQGEGDIISIDESTSTANPDGALTISVPTSEIVSAIVVAPDQVSIGQNMTVTMSVFNNGSPAATSVSPTALAVTGDATYFAGPTPGSWTVPGGESRDFSWTYTPNSAGNVTFNGYAFGVDSFTTAGVTSTPTDSNTVIVQTPAALSVSITADAYAEINREFDVTMRITNSGQATATVVVPLNLTWTATDAASVDSIGATSPATATVAGGAYQDFTWTVTAGSGIGTLTFNANAQGFDLNSGNTITATAVNSNAVNVIQGILNLVSITSPETQVYQGQKGLNVSMVVQNTSVNPITITASALDFNNNQQIGFIVQANPNNPQIAPPQSNFTLNYIVDVLTSAPLGTVIIDGTILWTGEGQNLSADGAATTATWEIVKAFNSMRQNFPNPLRLSKREFTIFNYFVGKDEEVSIKVYNLAGELVAVLFEGNPGIGQHQVLWYGDNGSPGSRGDIVGSGVYLAVFQIGEYKEMKKVVVIR